MQELQLPIGIQRIETRVHNVSDEGRDAPYVGEVESNEAEREGGLLTAKANPRNNATRCNFAHTVPRRSVENTSGNRNRGEFT